MKRNQEELTNKERQILWGAILRAKREKNGVTQEVLSKYLDIDQSTLARYEQGKIPMNLNNFVRICEFLRITPNEILNYGTDFED